MKKYENGQYIELSAEEVATLQTASMRAEAKERYRPYSLDEAIQFLLKEQLNTLAVDDQTALHMAAFYPNWEELVGKTAEQANFKFLCGGKLYKTLAPNHTFSSAWVPGTGTESLYQRIDEKHTGDLYDPIPYEGNMELTEGIYYCQLDVVYRCIRATGQPVYNPLAELVSIYVETA